MGLGVASVTHNILNMSPPMLPSVTLARNANDENGNSVFSPLQFEIEIATMNDDNTKHSETTNPTTQRVSGGRRVQC